MPAPVTTPDFLDVCRKSGVVDEGSLSAISGHSASSPMAAAKALIRAGVLTKFQAGQLLAGKYKGLRFDRLKILDRIGSGGMGTVFLCEHLGLRKQVAVKVLPPDQAGDEGVRARFYREARAAAALDHPNIVRVHDTNSSGGVHYIVMEYVDGQDLQTILNKYGSLPHTRACTYIAQAALGLQHAHEKGLVHRDIKPANLLVDKEGVVKILDMGLALFHEDEKDNLTAKYDKGAVLGTADYMAPEQIIASSTVDIRADIYSLGVTLYTLINGKPPFGGSCTQKLIGHTTHRATSLTEVRREVPKSLSAVVDKMMAKDPADRFQAPADVVEALTPWLEADTIPLDIAQTRKMPGTKLSRRRRLLPVADSKSKLPLIVGAVAVSAVLFGGLGVWALSGGKKDDKTNVSAADNSTTTGTAAAANTNSRVNPTNTGPSAPPSPRDDAKLVYEIDFAKMSPFTARFEDKNRVSMEGIYPAGWTTQSWRAGAVAEVGIQEHGGQRGVVIRTNRGDGGSAELHTAHGASPYRFIPGQRYLLRTEFANVGTQTGSFEVRFDAEHPPVKNNVPLRPTRGEWQTADLQFIAPNHQRVATYYTHASAVAPNYLVVRSVQLFEYSGDSSPNAATRSELVYEMDFSGLPRFQGTMAKPGGLTMQEGRLPEGWNCFVWKQDAAGEVAQEEFAGKKGIAFRTTAGDPSAEITTHTGRPAKATVKAGHRYRVELEYAAPGTAGGRLDLRLDDASKPGSDQIRLNPTGTEWRKATLEYTIPSDKDRAFYAYISNYGFGPANTLYIRSLKLTDLSAGAGSNVGAPAGAALYRFKASDHGFFKTNLADGQHVTSQGVPTMPAGFIAGCWRKEDAGEVAIEDVAGRKGLSLKNAEGSTSVQFFPGEAIAYCRGGQEYILKVTHWAGADADGRVEIRKPEGVNRIYTHPLKGTGGQWLETTARFTPDEDGPVHMYIQNSAGGDDAKLAVASVELAAPGTPMASGAYRLDLVTTKAFARRYKKDAVMASQGDGDLPAPWAGHTLTEETLGDIFADPVGGQLALGLRNHQGPPTVQLYTKSELLKAKSGKKYFVKVSYQTEANGKGWFQVAVNGTEANRSELSTSTGSWKDAEATLTAATDGPITMTIGGVSVGSESSIYVKSVEVKELP